MLASDLPLRCCRLFGCGAAISEEVRRLPEQAQVARRAPEAGEQARVARVLAPPAVPSAVRCDMVLQHQARHFDETCTKKGIGGEVRHGATSGVSRETSSNKHVTPHLHREYLRKRSEVSAVFGTTGRGPFFGARKLPVQLVGPPSNKMAPASFSFIGTTPDGIRSTTQARDVPEQCLRGLWRACFRSFPPSWPLAARRRRRPRSTRASRRGANARVTEPSLARDRAPLRGASPRFHWGRLLKEHYSWLISNWARF